MAKFCSHCGNELNEDAVVCIKCGCAAPNNGSNAAKADYSSVEGSLSIVDTVTKRIKTNGIIWMVIAGFQILLGISVNWFCLIVGVLNLISAIQDLNFSKQFLDKPIGIVAKMKPIGGAIVVLIYNLFVGGIIGVVGSIYYLVSVRGYVLENEQAFLEIENQNNTIS